MKIRKMVDNCMIPDGKVVTIEFDDGSVEDFDMYPREDIESFLERVKAEKQK